MKRLAVLSILILSFCAKNPPDVSQKAAPLPDQAFRACWDVSGVSRELEPGWTTTVTSKLTNCSRAVWTARRAGTDGRYAVRASYRWISEDGVTPRSDWIDRSELPDDLAPGDETIITFQVMAPLQRGTYYLQFDLVQELVAWFQDRGSPPGMVRVTVR